MAESFIIRGQETVLQFRGSVDAEEVQQYTVESKPSGIWFNVRLTKAEIDRGDGPATIAAVARLYEQVAAAPGVIGVSTYDDIDANNRIVPKLSVTVEGSDPNFTRTESGLDFRNGIGALLDRIAEIRAQLDADAGL